MDVPEELSDEERVAWFKFAAVLELLPSALDTQLLRDERLTHFDYFTLAILSEAPGRMLRMTTLAAQTNATLPRLSRVVSRLEDAGLLERRPCTEDGRATNAILTDAGLAKFLGASPRHVAAVRTLVIDTLTASQLAQLEAISGRLLAGLGPGGRMVASFSADSPKDVSPRSRQEG
jgi:DNA-binding MarR family transcriptional regulator